MERVASFLITIITFITIHGVTASSKVDPIVPAMFIFGDSYVDSGNNNNINTSTLDQANFPPYGENFTGSVPTGRFTNGQTIPDFIAKRAGFNSLTPVYLSTTQNGKKYEGKNFASGGAGALKETLKGYQQDHNTHQTDRVAAGVISSTSSEALRESWPKVGLAVPLSSPGFEGDRRTQLLARSRRKPPICWSFVIMRDCS
ncbi:GDSL esterase/lipase 5 [Striga hermonthica]|uniref:GDSL esterase/lipase 5 n=1 Tax=Striga hermonthica TaxID=68872 RepID=A0A9N7RG14_STRHE|nr:GDSL esterase/lipase 5 [Striga hermonthica]